jgi:spore coat-associated protein N
MKRILGLTIAFILLTGIGGIGTFAFFSDVETSASNQLVAGTLDLKTNDTDGVTQTLYADNLGPGETVGPETIILKNSGSIAGTSLDMSFSYGESDSSPNPTDMSANDTAAQIEVTALNYGGSNLLYSVSDNNTNGWKDIQDLANSDLSGQASIGPSANRTFEIAVQLRSDTSADFQADGINVNMTFILKQ